MTDQTQTTTEPVERIDIETLRDLFRCDFETGKLRWAKTKGRCAAGYAAGYVNRKGYLKVKVEKVEYAAHRIVWALYHGTWPEGPIDHANGNRADNSISNLRLATVSENNRNSTRAGRNATGFKGVKLDKRSKKYVSYVSTDEKRLYLGSFDTAAEAHEAYRSAAIKHHGEFCNVG